jgi:2-amino-4-hydroxy-6-hydroxymethyldihydropteridine diphosphokinase
LTPGFTPAYVGLGSNLGDPPRQIAAAVAALARVPRSRLVACSSLYRTPPLGPPDQPDYVNAVARLDTALTPRALLEALQAIERAQGRIRDGTRWGPRPIDLDLLVHGDSEIRVEGLTLPHAGIAARAFVLVPLQEIAAGLMIPGLAPLAELLAAVATDSIERIADPPC